MLRRARMVPLGQDPTEPAAPEAPPAAADGQVVAGDLVIDVPRREAKVGGRALVLKPKEFELLLYFARHPGIVMTRDALLREVWGYDFPVDTRTVDVHSRWLRQKIEDDPSLPERLVTVRGHGYRFVALDAAS
jgi:DNA-binding response OmpR family regulator